MLAVGNDRQFAALCEAVGAPELADDERFATNPARVEHRAALREALEERLAARPAAEWAAALTDARVPAGEVNDVAAAFRARGRARAAAGRQPAARGRLVRRPHAEPDRAVRDAAGVPHGAAAPAGARGVRASDAGERLRRGRGRGRHGARAAARAARSRSPTGISIGSSDAVWA